MGSFLIFEVSLDGIELPLPKPGIRRDPPLGLFDGAGVHPDVVLPTATGSANESGLFEHPEMPGDRRLRDPERLCQGGDARLPLGKLLQDASANGVRQGTEDPVEGLSVVEGFSIINHIVN